MTVYNRTRSKAEEVAELGATVADSPAEAARDAEVVMMSLADQNVVEKIVFGDGRRGEHAAERVVPGGHEHGAAAVRSRAGGARRRQRASKALDACVLGAPFHARSGELRVMVGGDEADFDAARRGSSRRSART